MLITKIKSLIPGKETYISPKASKKSREIFDSTRIISFIISVIKYLSLIIASLAAIIPILTVFFASFKTEEEYAATDPLKFPKNWLNFENFKQAFTDGNMNTGFINTIIILVFVLAGTIIFGTMVAYVLDRFNFKGRKLILSAFLIATLIPSVTTQVATFKVINGLGLFNSRLAPIILGVGTDIMAIYIFIQFISSIPVSLDESAMLDGASYFTIYRKIIFPLLKPAIATVVILKGIAVYNDFYTPFLYTPAAELQTVSTSLFKFKGPFSAHWQVICAGIVIAIIPTLIAFLFLQKYFYNGFTGGSVKS
ncbi:carbohydrate ABC transporter permease [Pseudobacteroides cellulosolvens]|uniref:ABC-type transporter, integral membrane subunit n=1 Tax=Pseudobacteroides cellulosolvens ATCC 35603 = DSM 2933 TaxID=398512 RepID=A0A0L6JM85_9FIRM|nr:carbohydrate ABC transporter permease [Pseudobacteroides cellulosolvens]KNY26865.1 ABC-type transporter, integral membrane subunit [Pseudobacteroides cellulosolvens ATCC 35603 = DSM 2933]